MGSNSHFFEIYWVTLGPLQNLTLAYLTGLLWWGNGTGGNLDILKAILSPKWGEIVMKINKYVFFKKLQMDTLVSVPNFLKKTVTKSFNPIAH